MNDKKEYLKKHLLQQKKINRLDNMLRLGLITAEQHKTEIENCKIIRQEIEKRIAQTDGNILSEILFLKYACGKSLEEISYIINYSLRHTERLHKKALEKFKI